MQERAEIFSKDAVKSLNSIDIIFRKSTEIREAWATLHDSLCSSPYNPQVVDANMISLLIKMASELGLAQELKFADFKRIYWPEVLVKERELRFLQQQDAIDRLANSPAANTISAEPR
jgi:hypothetical protein